MRRVDLNSRVPGVARTSVRDLDGRRVVWVEVSAETHRGALSSDSSRMIEAAARAAFDARIPLVAVMASSGADIREGFAALHGWGLAAKALTDCSGFVPTIIIVDGPAVSGPALLLGIVDHVVMTDQAYAFVSGPTMVEEFTGIAVDNEELGGPDVHAQSSGAATAIVPDLAAAIEYVERLLSFLPDHLDREPARLDVSDAADRPTPAAGQVVPSASTGSYDVRSIIEIICDDGDFLELRSRWAPNLVTCLASFGGRPVGIVANQPQVIYA